MEYSFAAISDYVGLLGTVLIFGMYLLLQTEIISSNSITYSLGNLLGSSLLLSSLFYNWNTAAVALQVCWIVVTIYALIKIFIRRIYGSASQNS